MAPILDKSANPEEADDFSMTTQELHILSELDRYLLIELAININYSLVF